VLGFQEGVGASHTSLLINTNLYIRIVEYSIPISKSCKYRNIGVVFCDKCKIQPHLDLIIM